MSHKTARVKNGPLVHGNAVLAFPLGSFNLLNFYCYVFTKRLDSITSSLHYHYYFSLTLQNQVLLLKATLGTVVNVFVTGLGG